MAYPISTKFHYKNNKMTNSEIFYQTEKFIFAFGVLRVLQKYISKNIDSYHRLISIYISSKTDDRISDDVVNKLMLTTLYSELKPLDLFTNFEKKLFDTEYEYHFEITFGDRVCNLKLCGFPKECETQVFYSDEEKNKEIQTELEEKLNKEMMGFIKLKRV